MSRTVLIIGGGPSGLTAALRLSAHGYAVTLVEQAERLGGRLLAGDSRAGPCDALPPVVMGHQTATRALLDELGTGERVPLSNSLRLEFQFPGGRLACLMQPWLPAPFHTIAGVMLFAGLPWSDRWRLFDVIERSWEGDPPLPHDLEERTADDWLAGRQQSDRARAEVWTPLARFLVGDDLTTISAASLVSALTRCFFGARRHGRLAVSSDTMQTLLIDPLAAHLARRGVSLQLNAATVLLETEGERVTGARLRDGRTLTADHYIVALPHHQLTAILPEPALTHFAYFQQLTRLSDSPALAVHLTVGTALQAPRVVLFARRTFHWLVSRPALPPRGGTLVSVVATGKHDLLERTDQDLIMLGLDELAYAYPGSNAIKLLEGRVVRQPQAFLTMSPGTRVLRPLPRSPFRNLFVGGDWTDTGLPATLEGAIVSGLRCAEAILAKKD